MDSPADQTIVETTDSPVEADREDDGLRFNFDGAPWKDVLDWFSQQG